MTGPAEQPEGVPRPVAGLLYDTPLRDPAEDRLGRAQFSRFLARAIRQMDADEGFVFALNGPWGSGKTTIINFALHFLKAEEEQDPTHKIVIVRFNPWWFSRRDQLLQQFFRQFGAALGTRDTSNELATLGRRLDALAKALEPIGVIPGVGSWTDRVKGVLKSVASVAKSGAEERAKDVHALREAIDSHLRAQDSRILIVIDDIDRLPAEEVRQLFQVVKAIADFPKTVYLLAFDRAAVVRALDRVQDGAGAEYLEKIVQAPFEMPSPDHTALVRLLTDHLDIIFHGTPDDLWDHVEWGNLFIEGLNPFICTPRDVKRLVNVLRPAYPIVFGEVHAVDFIGVQALRLFAPEVYEYVAGNKERLTGTEADDVDARSGQETLRQGLEAVVGALPEETRAPARDLVKRLFPKCRSVYGGAGYGRSWAGEWRRRRRVCSHDAFDVYFRLSVPLGGVAQSEVRAILDRAGDAEEFGRELVRLASERGPDGTPRLRVFLERLEDFTRDAIPIEHVGPILHALYERGDQLVGDAQRPGMFDIGDDMRLLRVSHQLLGRLNDADARADIVRQLVDQGAAIFLMTRLVSILNQEHERDGGESEGEGKTVSEAQAAELRPRVVARIRSAAEEGALRRCPNLGYVLWHWAEWEAPESVREFVSNLISSDEGLAEFLVAVSRVVHSHGYGDRVGKSGRRIDLQSLQKLTGEDPKPLLPRCKGLLAASPPWLDPRRREALETLISEVEEPRDEWGRRRRE